MDIASMLQEHRRLRDQLDMIEELVGDECVPMRQLREAYAEFLEDLQSHQRNEERLMETHRHYLISKGVERVWEEHRYNEPRIVLVLHRAFMDQGPQGRQHLHFLLREYAQRIRAHMDSEEKSVFPLVQEAQKQYSTKTDPVGAVEGNP